MVSSEFRAGPRRGFYLRDINLTPTRRAEPKVPTRDRLTDSRSGERFSAFRTIPNAVVGGVQYAPRGGFRALKKTTQAPYTYQSELSPSGTVSLKSLERRYGRGRE